MTIHMICTLGQAAATPVTYDNSTHISLRPVKSLLLLEAGRSVEALHPESSYVTTPTSSVKEVASLSLIRSLKISIGEINGSAPASVRMPVAITKLAKKI